MLTKRRSSFDPKSFLANVGEGRSIDRYRMDQIVFSQGDPADAVFYIQSGKVKLTVVSEQGKEAVVAMCPIASRSARSVPDVYDGLMRQQFTRDGGEGGSPLRSLSLVWPRIQPRQLTS